MADLLSTHTVARSQRFEYWREVICAVYVELAAEPNHRGEFSGTIELSGWGDTRISHVASSGQIVNRSPDTDRSDCLISLQVRGSGRVSQFGRTAVLSPGEFALYDTSAPYELGFDDEFAQIVVQFPREALVARNVLVESAVARKCSGEGGLGAVATSFIRSLAENHGQIDEADRRRLGDQAVDLTATALAEVTGALPTGEAVQRFNQQRVLTFVDRHLDDPELSVGWVAASLGVSPRTIQKLFADDEVPLSVRIRQARLARAERALADPRRRHHTIARIANDLGYGSPEQFARAFRAHRGRSPRDYREASLRSSQDG